MTSQKYVLYCPKCGRVEGFVPESAADDEDDTGEAETTIDDEVVDTPRGASTRVRCPRCGGWVAPDRVRPA
jgi:predicted RNA-binding Zn-ribbon protein involved in translation (DUF1610 family)